MPNGFLAAGRLEQLEKNQLKGVELDFEMKVDSALATYSYSSEMWWFPVYENGWLILFDPNAFDTYLRKSATYRKNHPSPYRGAYKDMGDPDLIVLSQDYQRRVDMMVKKFSD